MKSLFESEAFDEIKNRLDQLTKDHTRQWGQMTPGQMLHHCQAPLNIILEKKDYGFKPNWLVNLLFKKSMYSDKPWRKNLPTAPKLKEKEPKDFTTEKKHLMALLNEFDTQRDRENWNPHPSFGAFTKEQWGKMQYKHLDHHLKQFNG